MPTRRTALYVRFDEALLGLLAIVAAGIAALALVANLGVFDARTAPEVALSSTRIEPEPAPVVEVSSIRVEPAAQPVIQPESEPATTTAETASAEAETVNPPVAPISAEPEVAAEPLGPVERWASEGFVLVEEGQTWDAESLVSVDQALSLLPAWLRTTIASSDRGPVYILVNEEGRTLSGRQPYGRAANFFYTNEGRNELVLYPQQSTQTVLHELGHAYNLRSVAAGRYALVLLDPEMESFMTTAGWQVTGTAAEIEVARDHTQVAMTYDGPRIWTRLSNDDALEDFANSFALYFLAPEELRELSTVRFDWFETFIGR